MKRIFDRADILLPQNCDMTKWSVVACDQFSSQPEYWAALEAANAGVPSTLHLMFPEAYLETRDQFAEGVFRTLPDSYVYVERTLRTGEVRRGLLGVLDLDAYDYSKGSTSPIRATEGTIESRLPPRVRVREGAALEMPHIMVFIDDPENGVMGLLDRENGGHIRGWQVSGAAAERLEAALDALADPAMLRARYGDAAPVIYAMGDGNHSLATAKKCWEAIKPGLTEAERETHPARRSLVELVNIHDPAIGFEPIHKVLFETDPAAALDELGGALASLTGDADTCHTLRLVAAAGERELTVRGLTIGQLIGAAEDACQQYLSRHGGKIDYIHNDDTAIGMGRRPDGVAILLPRMEKGELFPSIVRSGPFPKKSFSIGHAQDKRYYLECRKIR